MLVQPQDVGIDRGYMYVIRIDNTFAREANFTVNTNLNLTNLTQASGTTNFTVQNDSLLVCWSQDGSVLYDTDGNGVRNINDCVPFTIG